MLPEIADAQVERAGLLVAAAERGRCRVVCFSPRHDLSLGEMEAKDIRAVVDTWTDEFRMLGDAPWTNYVQIFENRGALMGASNPHPHGQIWVNATPPNESRKEDAAQREYYAAHQSCLLCDYLALELKSRERVVSENEGFYALVPFWAVWPF